MIELKANTQELQDAIKKAEAEAKEWKKEILRACGMPLKLVAPPAGTTAKE